jgi:hypothetical protein
MNKVTTQSVFTFILFYLFFRTSSKGEIRSENNDKRSPSSFVWKKEGKANRKEGKE